MRLYLDAETNFANKDGLSIDFIEVQLKNGETISLNWDESDFGIEDGVFSARYKGLYFNEAYANGRLEKLFGMKVTEVGFNAETNKPLDFIITDMQFEEGEAELSITYPYAIMDNAPVSIEQLNTKIEYLYRDASNYKVYNECVINGIVTAKQREEIVDCLSEGEYFIPSQVGLSEKRFDDWTEDDHPWFELYDCDFHITKEVPTVAITADELVNAFKEAKDNWHNTMDISNTSEILPLESRINSIKAVTPKEQVESVKTKNIEPEQQLR